MNTFLSYTELLSQLLIRAVSTSLTFSMASMRWTFVLCFLRFSLRVNDLLHKSHSWGFRPVCDLSCTAKFDLIRKEAPHVLHEKSFSLLCIFWCLTRYLWVAKFLPHVVHSKLSELLATRCSSLCLAKLVFSVKYLPQSSQEYGFSPEWLFTCRCQLPLTAKDFWQISHVNGFSPVCVRLWLIRRAFLTNADSQVSQENSFSSPPWTRLCFWSWFLLSNALEHTLQVNCGRISGSDFITM